MSSNSMYFNARNKEEALAAIKKEKMHPLAEQFFETAVKDLNVYKDGMICLRGDWTFPPMKNEPPYQTNAYMRVEVTFNPYHEVDKNLNP